MTEIAIMGYGVVGSGVAEVLSLNKDYISKRTGCNINLKKILDIRDFPGDPFENKLTKNAQEILSDPQIAIIIETIGGTGIAYELTKKALNNGKSVVTSNKELVATHGPELLQIAFENKISYLFEASVGGGIPIIRPLNKCLSGNKVEGISGILNGTTNYILTEMKNNKISFQRALSQAQNLGYAEQNPVSDIEGTDACRKLAILASIATAKFIDYKDIFTQGISKITIEDMQYAADAKYKIKLLAQIRKLDSDSPEAIVAPMLISDTSPLAVADDVYNAILVEGNVLGTSMFYGQGAGKLPTASAIVADVIEAALHKNKTPHRILWETDNPVKIKDHGECPVSVFLRITKTNEGNDLVNALEKITDVKRLQINEEIVIFAGIKKPLTEKYLRENLLHTKACISAIRINNYGV